jgi:hypothetical protein
MHGGRSRYFSTLGENNSAEQIKTAFVVQQKLGKHIIQLGQIPADMQEFNTFVGSSMHLHKKEIYVNYMLVHPL